MAWNPHTDKMHRGYNNLLTQLFPEQTKTLPRIIVWSIVFLLDLFLGAYVVYYLGLFDNFRDMNQMIFCLLPLLAAIIGIFWLQGFLWGKIAALFKK